MPKIDHIQTSFSGGEFGTSLYGRTDVAQYGNACAIVENFLIRPYGSVISTPGTRFINKVKDSSKKTRLIKFVFNQTDAYVIEMGDKYFRFYTNGGVVVTTGTTPFELAHIYLESELFEVQFTQLNDVIWLSHPDHPIQKLTRLATASWTIADFAYIGGPFLDDNTTATTIAPSASSGTINLTASSGLFTVSSGSTKGHTNTYWKLGTTLTNSTTALDEQGYVKITYVTSATTATASVLKLLSVDSATTDWAEAAWSDVRGWPAKVTFHERRLFFARTNEEPQVVWGSKVFEYDNFALDGAADDDGLNMALASNESNEIQWLTSGKSLIAGTYGGAFVINSGSTDPLTPSNTNASNEINIGTTSLTPRKIGSFIYYVQRFGKKIREMFYFWDLDAYKSEDKTIFSPHILGDGIVDMDYQQTPETILYCVTTEGTLATFTREIDQQVQAWSRQTTEAGAALYESVAVIPSQTKDYDEVWVVVNRTITGSTVRYIEAFEDIEVPARQDLCLYLHSALTYNAYEETSLSPVANISLSGTSGTVTVTTNTTYFYANDVGQRIRAINSIGATIGELDITGYTSGTVVYGVVTYTFSALTYAGGLWGVSVNEISGLDHLEGKTVSVLADGGTDKPNKTVSAGTISLEYDYFVVNAGLPYDQILYTLPREAGSQRGTSQGKIQKINEVAFKVNRSHTGFKVGGTPTDSDLERISFRDPSTLMGTTELLYTGVIPNISFRDDYRYGSQIYIKNEDPLPLEILNIICTLETFDK